MCVSLAGHVARMRVDDLPLVMTRWLGIDLCTQRHLNGDRSFLTPGRIFFWEQRLQSFIDTTCNVPDNSAHWWWEVALDRANWFSLAKPFAEHVTKTVLHIDKEALQQSDESCQVSDWLLATEELGFGRG